MMALGDQGSRSSAAALQRRAGSGFVREQQTQGMVDRQIARPRAQRFRRRAATSLWQRGCHPKRSGGGSTRTAPREFGACGPQNPREIPRIRRGQVYITRGQPRL